MKHRSPADTLHPLQPPPDSAWSLLPQASWPPRQRHWLLRPGALSGGLRQLGRFELRVALERVDALDVREAWTLCRPARHPIWLREVVMSIDGVDAVFARSFTPLPASQATWQAMRRLRTRPLADMLYHDPRILRSPFAVSRLNRTQPLWRSAVRTLGAPASGSQPLWARLSVFWCMGQPLMVAECFLPGFWQLPGHPALPAADTGPLPMR